VGAGAPGPVVAGDAGSCPLEGGPVGADTPGSEDSALDMSSSPVGSEGLRQHDAGERAKKRPRMIPGPSKSAGEGEAYKETLEGGALVVGGGHLLPPSPEMTKAPGCCPGLRGVCGPRSALADQPPGLWPGADEYEDPRVVHHKKMLAENFTGAMAVLVTWVTRGRFC
jgi:hypothetical protein